MMENSSLALDTALAYYQSWTTHDFDGAMTYIAEDVTCDAPAGPISGAEAFRAFMGPFAEILIRAQLIAAFGDHTTAVLIYDAETVPVKDAPGAECLTVQDGKITHICIEFDRAPFVAARAAAAAEVQSAAL